ncbi:DENN domain and WD repeat-containing protein SCD1 [Carex littledalei]|uniref:DENN domain and WD repeat-containing protein SCD1 n=1 Tax=Carex littledalei TaxID=544730 RepID=A0A833V018_9POAL|nr:DENN domain and WD repeat-containing protein SCD1 [Carex littledalei]
MQPGGVKNPLSIFPSQLSDPEIITISEPEAASTVSEAINEKTKPTYAEVVANGDSELDKMSAMEREAERLRMVLDIKVKLQMELQLLVKLNNSEVSFLSFLGIMGEIAQTPTN